MPRARRPRKRKTKQAKDDRAGLLFLDPEPRRPLPSLAFLSPFLAFYAFGLIWVRPDLVARADLLVRRAIEPLGLTGVLAPTWLVVTVLMTWHLVRRDATRVSLRLLGRMLFETLILTVPLFALAGLGLVVRSALALAAGAGAASPGWLGVAMTSIGAGVYEELLFRLLMVGGTLWLAHKVLRRESEGVVIAVVLIAAAVFAGAHTLDDPTQFRWASFLFRTAAGTYLGYVFAHRGFGIAAGVHMVYDLAVKLAVVGR